MIVFATKSVAARRRLTPPQEAAFGIRLYMQCRRTLLDEVDDPLYARRRGNAGSAATSVSFALLRGCHQ